MMKEFILKWTNEFGAFLVALAIVGVPTIVLYWVVKLLAVV